MRLGEGPSLVVQAFEPAEGLLAVELESSPVDPPDSVAVATQAALAAGRLAAADSTLAVVGEAARLLREQTGFDRVWAYRFEADGHGVIVAEERPEHLEPFLGLHFPETDIPAQARALYLNAGLRLIGDSGRSDVPLIPS